LKTHAQWFLLWSVFIRFRHMLVGNMLNVISGMCPWYRSTLRSIHELLIVQKRREISALLHSNVRVWSISNSNYLHILKGHQGHIRSVAFRPTGRLLASGGEDDSIRIWNVSTGECIQVLSGHKAWVRSVTFHPKKDILASGSLDGTIKF